MTSDGALIGLACYKYESEQHQIMGALFFRLEGEKIVQLCDSIFIPSGKCPLDAPNDEIYSAAMGNGFSIFVSTSRGVLLLSSTVDSNFLWINDSEHVKLAKVKSRQISESSTELVVGSRVGINTTVYSGEDSSDELRWSWNWFPCDGDFVDEVVMDFDLEKATGKGTGAENA